MDFSAIGNALDAIKAQENAATATTPVKITFDKSTFDTQKALAEAQKRKKENEMSHRTKVKREKKVERSKGYFEKLEAKDKEKKKKDKRPNPKPHEKKQK